MGGLVTINGRCLKELRLLAEAAGSPMTLRELARNIDVSERTVRYDLDALEGWCRERGIALVRRRGVGVSIDRGSLRAARDLFRGTGELSGVFLDAGERVRCLAATILLGEEERTFDELAERFSVSRSTILRDMDGVEAWFKNHGLSVDRHQKRGVRLSATEMQRRLVMVDFCREEVGLSPLSWSHVATDEAEVEAAGLFGLLTRQDFLDAIEVLDRQMEAEGEELTDDSFVMVSYYLAIMRMRIARGCFVGADDCRLPARSMPAAGELLSRMLSQGGDTSRSTFDGDARDAEQRVLAAVLDASGRAQLHDYPVGDLAVRVYGALITAMSCHFGFDFTIEHELMVALKNHIDAMLTRNAIGIGYGELAPLEVADRFRDAAEVCRTVVDRYTVQAGIHISDAELSYIVLYFAAALERFRMWPEADRSLRVVLVCGANIATVAFLERALKRTFPVLHIVRSISASQLRECDCADFDVVLTTVDIDWVLPRPIIRVSPMLTRLDVRRIDAFLHDTGVSAPMQSDPVADILSIVEGASDIHDRDVLKARLQRYFDKGADAPAVPAVKDAAAPPGSIEELPHLADCVLRRFVQARVSVDSWEAAVLCSAEPMLRAGYMTEGYLHGIFDMSKRYRQFGVICPGLCMPHANADGGNTLALSLVTLAHPVEVDMGQGYCAPIQVMLVITPADGVRHARCVDELFMLCSGFPTLVDELVAATSADELYRVFQRMCARLAP